MIHAKSVGIRLSQRGDTLVEVLICILIVSLILTGAFVTTNRSTIAVRDAQEHAEALKLAQGQVEQIRQNASTSTPAVFTQTLGSTFCMYNGSVITAGNQCGQDSSGTPTISEPIYHLAAQRSVCSTGTNCHNFTVQVTWASVTGKGNATEQIVYRLHK